MTRDQATRWLKAIQGFIEGKEIQYKDISGEWKDVKDPTWFNTEFIGEYRVKPEVIKVCGWAVVRIGTYLATSIFTNEAAAEKCRSNTNHPAHWKVVKLEGTYEC